ncbi:MAG: universal stress protein [Cyanobacteria bacterium J06614_10]
MKKILVALDSGDTCQRVFDQASEIAQAVQAKVNLLSVLNLDSDAGFAFSPYAGRDWQAYAEKYQSVETASVKLLEGFADRAKAAGLDTEYTYEPGSPGSVICKLAKAWGADLVIVGSHGRKGFSEMLLGSVSNYVVHHAPCSVMVIHGPTTQ